jgi:hypothetical protein
VENSIHFSFLAHFLAFTDKILENDKDPTVLIFISNNQPRINSIMTVSDTSVGTMGIQSQ